jgi:hypothetical protein
VLPRRCARGAARFVSNLNMGRETGGDGVIGSMSLDLTLPDAPALLQQMLREQAAAGLDDRVAG